MLKPVTVCSRPKTKSFFAARAAGVRGTLAHAFANEVVASALPLELGLASVIAPAEPASPSTATAPAIDNTIRLRMRSTLRSDARREPRQAARSRSNASTSVHRVLRRLAVDEESAVFPRVGVTSQGDGAEILGSGRRRRQRRRVLG